MSPDIWGPKIWYLLHIIMIHPTAKQSVYKEFFYNLQFLLPCENCRNSYKEHIIAIPFPKTKTENSDWLINVHNRVNKSTNKPILDLNTATNFWKNEYKNIEKLDLYKIGIYFLYGHEGKYKISKESIAAHLYFWENIHLLLPKLHIEKLHISEEIVKSKIKYREWLKTL